MTLLLNLVTLAVFLKVSRQYSQLDARLGQVDVWRIRIICPDWDG
jgi:hypothetical protein